jgi:hypothetical protein
LAEFVQEHDEHRLVVRNQIQEILLYVIFLALFSFSTLSAVNDPNIFYFSEGIRNQLEDVEFSQEDAPTWNKSFKDIATVLEYHQWLRGVFHPVLYSRGTFDGEPGDTGGFVLGQGRVLGGIRIGQIRGEALDCTTKLPMFKNQFANGSSALVCYGDEYGDLRTGSSEDKRDFGPDSRKYTWEGWDGTSTSNERTQPGSTIRTEDLDLLPSPAYSILLPNPGEEDASARALQTLDDIVTHDYIDLQTRAVVVDVTILNVMLSRIITVRIVAIMPKAGGVMPLYKSTCVDAQPFPEETEPVQLLSTFVIVLFYLFYIWQEVTILYYTICCLPSSLCSSTSSTSGRR